MERDVKAAEIERREAEKGNELEEITVKTFKSELSSYKDSFHPLSYSQSLQHQFWL